jgi:hypothetical protein
MATLPKEAAGAALDVPAAGAAAVAVPSRAATPPRGGAGGGALLSIHGDASQPCSASPFPSCPGGRGTTAGDGKPLQRVFCVDGPVNPRLHFVANRKLWHAEVARTLCRGSYVLLHAHRQGGKTSAIRGVRRAIQKQRQHGHLVLTVSLKGENLSSGAAAWRSLALAIRDCAPSVRQQLPHGTVRAFSAAAGELLFTDFDSFLAFFELENWGGHRVVLIIDDFDGLLAAPAEVQADVLCALRVIRDSPAYVDDDDPPPYALHAVLGMGVYRMLTLCHPCTGRSFDPPFYVASAVTPPDPTPDDVRAMFHDYDAEYGVSTAPDVVDDIMVYAGGHVGLLSLLGQQLHVLYTNMATAPTTVGAAQPTADSSSTGRPLASVSMTQWRSWLCHTDTVARLRLVPTVQAAIQTVHSPRAGPVVAYSLRYMVLTMLAQAGDHSRALYTGRDPEIVEALELMLSEGVVVQVNGGYRFASQLHRLLLFETMGTMCDWGIPAGLDVPCLEDGSMDMSATLLSCCRISPCRTTSLRWRSKTAESRASARTTSSCSRCSTRG